MTRANPFQLRIGCTSGQFTHHDRRSTNGWSPPSSIINFLITLRRGQCLTDAASAYEANVTKARKKLSGQFDPLDLPTIAFLAETFRVESMEEDEAARWSPEERELRAGLTAQLQGQDIRGADNWAGDEKVRGAAKRRETLLGVVAHCRELRAAGDLDGIVNLWGDEAEGVAEAKGLTVSPDRTCRRRRQGGYLVQASTLSGVGKAAAELVANGDIDIVMEDLDRMAVGVYS